MVSPLLAFGLLVLSSPVAQAYVDYQINCTLPATGERINFAGSPNIRGTMDILWTCISVLILCVWNIQHLAVPPHFKIAEKGNGMRADVVWNLKEVWKKTKWMILMIIMPEYLFGKAVCEHCAAKWSVAQFARPLPEDREHSDKEDKLLPWSMVHGYFANMRGFVLRFEAQTVPTDLKPMPGSQEGKDIVHVSHDDETSYLKQPEQDTIDREKRQWEKYCQEHGIVNEWLPSVRPTSSGQSQEIRPVAPLFDKPKSKLRIFAKTKKEAVSDAQEKAVAPSDTTADQVKVMSPSSPIHPTAPMTVDISITPADPPTGDDIVQQYPRFSGAWALSSHQLVHAYELGILKVPTRVPVHEIQDKSKGDGMAKAITVMQITWLVVQIIARAVEGLAITLLEITVLAFATTAFAIYFVIWDKPQSVHTPIFIDADRLLTRRDVIELAARAPKASLFVQEFWLYGVSVRGMADNIFPYSKGIELKTPMWLHNLMTRSSAVRPSRNGQKNGKNSPAAAGPPPSSSTHVASDTKDEHTTTQRHRPTMIVNPILFGLGLGGAIFGVVHCAAWNFKFPSGPEQLLWQISCLVIVMFPIFSALIYWVRQHMAERNEITDTDWTNKVLIVVCPPIVVLYMLARIYLCVEVFRSLVNPVEPSIFLSVDWTQLLPHLG